MAAARNRPVKATGIEEGTSKRGSEIGNRGKQQKREGRQESEVDDGFGLLIPDNWQLTIDN